MPVIYTLENLRLQLNNGINREKFLNRVSNKIYWCPSHPPNSVHPTNKLPSHQIRTSSIVNSSTSLSVCYLIQVQYKSNILPFIQANKLEILKTFTLDATQVAKHFRFAVTCSLFFIVILLLHNRFPCFTPYCCQTLILLFTLVWF